jgi:hypothetical protein
MRNVTITTRDIGGEWSPARIIVFDGVVIQMSMSRNSNALIGNVLFIGLR